MTAVTSSGTSPDDLPEALLQEVSLFSESAKRL